MPRTRLVAVDGLRDLAVLLVLVHHFVELQLPREIGSGQAYLPLAHAAVGGLPMAAFGYPALGLPCTAVLLAVLDRRPAWLARFCEQRVPVFIGGISHFIYLFQAIVGWPVFRVCGLTMPAPGTAGAVSWRLLEARLIALGRRFTYRLSPSSQPALPSRNPS